MPAVVETPRDALTGDALRTADIRWAQVELRYRGLYQGSLDGIVGPETKQALGQFQKINGLDQTASLDAHTFVVLTGNPRRQGQSSTPGYAEAITNEFAASGLGR
jgi:peptidoglycan hydrolase-like protein with peptidoglycan-binding domain